MAGNVNSALFGNPRSNRFDGWDDNFGRDNAAEEGLRQLAWAVSPVAPNAPDDELRCRAAIINRQFVTGREDPFGRMFSGEGHGPLDGQTYYNKMITAWNERSVESLFTPEAQEYRALKTDAERTEFAVSHWKKRLKDYGKDIADAMPDAAGPDPLSRADMERLGDVLSEEDRTALDEWWTRHDAQPSWDEAVANVPKAPDEWDGSTSTLDPNARRTLANWDASYAEMTALREKAVGISGKYRKALRDAGIREQYEAKIAAENQFMTYLRVRDSFNDDEKGFLDHALMAGGKSRDWWTGNTLTPELREEFMGLPVESQRKVAPLIAQNAWKRDTTLVGDALRGLVNLTGETIRDAGIGAADYIRRLCVNSEDYQNAVERRALLREAESGRMKEWGLGGEIVIGVIENFGYAGLAAVPYAGPAAMMLSAGEQFEREAAREGIDVSGFDMQLAKFALSAAYAGVEGLQSARLLKPLNDSEMRLIYGHAFDAMYKGLKARLAADVALDGVHEIIEEGVQGGLQSVYKAYGSGESIPAAFVESFVHDSIEAAPTMFATVAVGAGGRVSKYKNASFVSGEDIVRMGLELRKVQQAVGDKGTGREGLPEVGRMLGFVSRDWRRAAGAAAEAGAGAAELRKAALMKYGLTEGQAVEWDAMLTQIERNIGEDKAAVQAFYGTQNALTRSEIRQAGGMVETVDEATGARTLTFNDMFGTGTFSVELNAASGIDAEYAKTDEGVRSIVNALNDSRKKAPDGGAWTDENWRALPDADKQSILSEFRNPGLTTFKLATGETVDNRFLAALEGMMQIADNAESGDVLGVAAFHEQGHVAGRMLALAARNGDEKARELVGKLAEKFGTAKLGSEEFDEEVFGDRFRDYLVGRFAVEDGRLVRKAGALDVAAEDETLFGQFVDWVRSMFSRADEAVRTRTRYDEFFEQAVSGDLEGAVAADDASSAGAGAQTDGEGVATESGGETVARASIVSDKRVLEELESGPTVKVYRAMQLRDGKLYPPMAGKVDGKWQNPVEFGAWMQADERPDLVKNGKFTLNKGNGASITAAYNPYWHTSRSPLNDQFSSAYKRPELVTVECEVPASELTSGYRAEGAKDAVGEMSWHSGPVSSRLAKVGQERKVILSRYVKVNRIVPDAEVADVAARMLDGTGISIPANVVTPSLRAELEKRGVEVGGRGAGARASIRAGALTDADREAIAAAVSRAAQSGVAEVVETEHAGRVAVVGTRIQYSNKLRESKPFMVATGDLRGTSAKIPASKNSPEREIIFDRQTQSEYANSKSMYHLRTLAKRGTDDEKTWARKTLSAKISIARNLPSIIATASNERHKTLEELNAVPGHEKSSGRWGGGIYEYDVSFNVGGDQYTARMVVRCNSNGEMFLYDVVAINDGSAIGQAYEADYKARKGEKVLTEPLVNPEEEKHQGVSVVTPRIVAPPGGGVNGDFEKKSQSAASGEKGVDSRAEGGIMEAQGETGHGTQADQEADNEFRRLQEESRGVSAQGAAEYHAAQRALGGIRERLARVLPQRVARGRRDGGHGVQLLTNAKTGAQMRIGPVDGATFHDVFEIVRTYLPYGDLVDLHDAYGEDVKCYLSDSGLSGFAVEADGNIVSVFNLAEGGGFLQTVMPLIKEAGGVKLDCYALNQEPNLPSLYERAFNFKPAANMAYDESFEPEDEADERHGFGRRHGMPRIVFMVADPGHAIENKSFDGDYDAAVAWQSHNTPAPASREDSRASIRGPSMSKMDAAIAFAARDAMTGRSREDADYQRLIDALGIGKMYTPQELRKAGEAVAAAARMKGEGEPETRSWRTRMKATGNRDVNRVADTATEQARRLASHPSDMETEAVREGIRRNPTLRELAKLAEAGRRVGDAIKAAYSLGERAGVEVATEAQKAEDEMKRAEEKLRQAEREAEKDQKHRDKLADLRADYQDKLRAYREKVAAKEAGERAMQQMLATQMRLHGNAENVQDLDRVLGVPAVELMAQISEVLFSGAKAPGQVREKAASGEATAEGATAGDGTAPDADAASPAGPEVRVVGTVEEASQAEAEELHDKLVRVMAIMRDIREKQKAKAEEQARKRAEREEREEAEAKPIGNDDIEAEADEGEEDSGETNEDSEPEVIETVDAAADPEMVRAMLNALKTESLDLNTSKDFATYVLAFVMDSVQQSLNMEFDPVFRNADPIVKVKFRKTLIDYLRATSDALLDPTDDAAAKLVERQIGDIKDDASVAQLWRAAAGILGVIQRRGIQQSRRRIMRDIDKYLKRLAGSGRKLDPLAPDLSRRMTARAVQDARWLRRVLKLSNGGVIAEQNKLQHTIEERQTEGGDATDVLIDRAMRRMRLLEQFGGLRYMMPAEIKVAQHYIEDRFNAEAMELARKAEERKARTGAVADALIAAADATREALGGFDAEDGKGMSARGRRLLDSLAGGSLRQRLQHLTGDDPAARRAVDEIVRMVFEGETQHRLLEQQFKREHDAILQFAAEAGGIDQRTILRQLDENVPDDLSRALATPEQNRQLKWGQALQLLVSLEQTASYGDNITLHHREGHADLIREAMKDRPQFQALINNLRETYRDRRGMISEVMERVTGLPVLSPDPLFMPVRMKSAPREGLDMKVKSWTPWNAIFSPRVKNNLDFDTSADIMGVFDERSRETAKSVAFAETGLDLRSILGRKETQTAFIRARGAFFNTRLIEQVTDALNSGYTTPSNDLINVLRPLGTACTYASLSWNVVTMLKQMTSIPAWTAVMDGGYGELFKAMTSLDRKSIEEFMDAEGFRSRYGVEKGGWGTFAKIIRDAFRDPSRNYVQRFYDAGMTLVQFGDFVPSFLIGPGVYKARKAALMRQNPGMAEEAAKKQALSDAWSMVEQCQQSDLQENLHDLLRRQGVVAKQVMKFCNSPLMQVAHEVQSARMWADAARRAKAGEAGAQETADKWRARFVNQIVCNHVIMPAAMYAAELLVKAALGNEPPDKDEVMGRIVAQMLLGSWGKVFLLGMILDKSTTVTSVGVGKMTGLYNYKPSIYTSSSGAPAGIQLVEQAIDDLGRIGSDFDYTDWESVRDDTLRMISRAARPVKYGVDVVYNYNGIDRAKNRMARRRKIRKERDRE